MTSGLPALLLTNNVVKANSIFAVCIPSYAEMSNYISLIIQSSHQLDDSCLEIRQPYHPAAKTGCPLKLSRAEPGQYLDGRPPGKN